MKKMLLLLSTLVLSSGQILAKGFTISNSTSNQKIWVRADAQLADNKQKLSKGAVIKSGYISIDAKQKQYIETDGGDRGAQWKYDDEPTIYYTYLKYSSPDNLTISSKNQKYIMKQTIGYKSDEQLPLTLKDKQAKQEIEKKDKEAAEKQKKLKEQEDKDKAELASEVKKINGYKDTEALFKYIDEKKQVISDTNASKSNANKTTVENKIKKLETYMYEALDQIVKKYSDQINKKVDKTEFSINTLKVELNKIETKIKDRTSKIEEPIKEGPLKNIYALELKAYKGPKYSISEKSGIKFYEGILSAITTRRGNIGVSSEAKPFAAFADKQIEKEKDYKTLKANLEKTEKEISRLKLKEAAESYVSTGYKISTDKNFEDLEKSIEKINARIDEVKKIYKEQQAEIAKLEKEAREEKDKKAKEAKAEKAEETKKAKETEITNKEAEITSKEAEIKTKETAAKSKEKELELENKKTSEEEEKNKQEIIDLEKTVRTTIDADLETEKIKINAKYADQANEQEKKAELEALEQDKSTKLKTLITDIALKQVEQKKSIVKFEQEVDRSKKQKIKELEELNKELELSKKDLPTLKAALVLLNTDLSSIKKELSKLK